MKTTELRIGNWVYNAYIEENMQVYPMMIPQLHRIEKEKGSLKDCNIEPIPLTEEILLKCGFEIDGIFCYIKSFQSIYLVKPWREANHFLLKTIGGECLSKLQHLHQLQNLYFDLCGEELEINL